MYQSLDKNHQKNIDKYLSKWSDHSQFDYKINHIFDNVLVIPAYNEDKTIAGQIRNIQSITKDSETTLVIYVINQPKDNHDDLIKNKYTYDRLKQIGTTEYETEKLFVNCCGNLTFIVLDYFTKPLGSKQGVGLARKIGADTALKLFKDGLVNTLYFYSSDGDATFPTDYFEEQTDKLDKSLILKNFIHKTDFLNDQYEVDAINYYDFYLRYYVEMMSLIGSPYAFHTIGSCFMVSFYHYACVRGFPQKSAGEDFYLANKLAKVAPVGASCLEPIILQARVSGRVPFGTGPSIKKISQNLRENIDYTIFSQSSFKALGSLLTNSIEFLSLDDHSNIIEVPHDKDKKIMNQLRRSKSVSANEETRVKSFLDWFDGLRQLQYLNTISREAYSKVDIERAIANSGQVTHRNN